MRIIALCGYMGSGKDTVAEILVSKYRYRRLAFADVLKNMCALKHGLCRWYFDDRNIKELPLLYHDGKSPRDLCIELAQEEREKDPDVFVNQVISYIMNNPDNDYVISDCRFPNELEGLVKCNKIDIWYIHRFDDPPSTHFSETSLSSKDSDIFIDNTKDILHLESQIEMYIKYMSLR